ncbi:uncharacterized protein [Nicotiana sylvestris]|uniref:uncharacterized protein n=1 Tax=Nicotiana sylvestris TaxID=4096 RepID=UPI00388CD6CD
MEHQLEDDNNPLQIPPPAHVEEHVRKPPVAANNFEIRTGLIQTIQQSCIFTGDLSEDTHSHLIDFLELVEPAKYNGVPPEAIKLRLFPFSLKGEAKTWLRSLPQGSITTWDQMTQKFLNKYFSPAKTTKLRQDISNFLQTDTESVYQAWERLKTICRRFYNGKNHTEEELQLLNEISENAIQWPSEHVNTQQPGQSEACNLCGENHLNHECQATNQNDEQVNVIGYKPYPFGSSLAQKHPGFKWSNANGAENSQNYQKQHVVKGENVKTPSQPSEEKEAKKKEEENTKNLTSFLVTISFPQKMKRENLDNQFAKFLEVLKQIHINIPFTNALLQMSSYAKFLKEILLSKRKFEEVSVVMLTKKYSAILQNNLPQKLGDPDLGEMKDIGVSLQFVDPSTKRPKGIIENVLVRADKFIFPVDFIVLEMKECPDKTIILGRPFLATDEFKDDQLNSNSMERCLAKSGSTRDEDPTIRNDAKLLEKDYEEGGMSLEEVQPKIELKTLPCHLKYVYLEHELFPVIISSSLTREQEEILIELQTDSPTPKEIKPSNAGSGKKEIVKLLAASIIYPISDSPWLIIALQRVVIERCMPRNSSRTGELLEGLSNPEKTFRALNRANKKNKQSQQTHQLEIDMGDVNNVDRNIRDEPADLNVRVVAPLVPEAALYDWAQPTADNLATAIVVPQ